MSGAIGEEKCRKRIENLERWPTAHRQFTDQPIAGIEKSAKTDGPTPSVAQTLGIGSMKGK